TRPEATKGSGLPPPVPESDALPDIVRKCRGRGPKVLVASVPRASSWTREGRFAIDVVRPSPFASPAFPRGGCRRANVPARRLGRPGAPTHPLAGRPLHNP